MESARFSFLYFFIRELSVRLLDTMVIFEVRFVFYFSGICISQGLLPSSDSLTNFSSEIYLIIIFFIGF